MISYTLSIFPGNGMNTYSCYPNTTLQQVVDQHNLQGKQICVNGQTVQPNQFGQIRISNGTDISALQPTKGNC